LQASIAEARQEKLRRCVRRVHARQLREGWSRWKMHAQADLTRELRAQVELGRQLSEEQETDRRAQVQFLVDENKRISALYQQAVSRLLTT
jgi:hypothetical protein